MLFGVCRGLDDYVAMECAKKAGIDYFETGFGCLANFDDEKFNKGKEKLESLGLPCLIANGFIPGDMKLVGDEVDYKSLEDYLVRGFKRAEEIGVKIIVFGSGGARSYPEGFSPEKAREQFVYFLKEYAAPMAKKAGCIIVIEPLRFCESSMIHMVSDGIEMSRLSGADNVFGLADLYHVYGNNDDIDAMKQFNGMIKHCHIAEPEKRAYPSLAKDSDCVKATYKKFLDVMSAAGCDTCSIEARTDDFCNDVADAIALLRNL
jgi:sugar phosphate isomerase/epimerase